jgi:Holliday junction resolvase RusA-like endonuclease
MRNVVYYKIDSLPVSVNNAVRHSYRGSYKTNEFKEWDELVSYQKQQTINKSEWYGVEIVFHMPLYFKNGNIRRKDADDMLKYAIDCTLKRVVDSDENSIDDSRIMEGNYTKVNDDHEYTEISFYTID